MCTLTYLLTDCGYELFFNRDEQRTRQVAEPPTLNQKLNAIYPIDPVGQGSWLAVHNSGLSLALLNFYQAEQVLTEGTFLSRGQIILSLLKDADNVIPLLKAMDLTQYSAFQLCIFEKDLSKLNNRARTFQWNGQALTEVENTLPITSSSIEFPAVYKHRRARFLQTVDSDNPTREQFLTYHRSQETQGKLSVKMFRADASTVSLSHIVVAETITFTYFDYINNGKLTTKSERLPF